MERTEDNPESTSACRFGRFILERAQRRLLRDGVPVELEERVFDLILLLLDNRARALDRREVIGTLWGKRPVGDATLRQLLFKARRALDDDGTHQTVIRTLHGRSLQWVAPVAPLLDRRTPPVAVGELEPTPLLARTIGAHVPGASSTPVNDSPSAGRGPIVSDEADPDPAGSLPLVPRAGAESPTRSPHRRAAWAAVAFLLLLALVAVPVTLWWLRAPRSAASPKPQATVASTSPVPAGPVTLGVLPFLNMDADPGRDYLSDGLTEELIDRLGHVRNLRVAARTSAFVFRDKPVDIREAAHALGVANILEGSVQRSGERWRVRVALANASDGYVRWTAEYDPPSNNLIAVEDTIARKVVEQLQPKLDPRALAAMHAPAPADPAAHDFYLIGLQYSNRWTPPDNAQAIAYFRRAIQADPNYAPAWSGLAMAYAVLREFNGSESPDLHYADGLAAANKAITLDPRLSHPRGVLGELYDEHWQWARAAREFKLALRLDPSNAIANKWYALHLWYTGDNAGALAQMRKARDLDPLSPIINTDLGRALLFNGDEQGAIAQYRATITMTPNFALAHLLLAQAEMARGDDAAGLAEARTGVALTPTPHPSGYLAVLGVAESVTGDTKGAEQQLMTLESRSQRQYVSGASLALLYWQLGDKDKAIASFARAIDDHDPLMRPAVAAHMAGWHSDPRFKELVAKMGLPH